MGSPAERLRSRTPRRDGVLAALQRTHVRDRGTPRACARAGSHAWAAVSVCIYVACAISTTAAPYLTAAAPYRWLTRWGSGFGE